MRERMVRSLVAAFFCAALPSMAAQLLIPPGATITVPSGTLVLACSDLTVQGTLSAGSAQIGPAGNLTIATGATLSAGSSTLTVGGNWASTGTFSGGTSTVVFADGCTASPAQISGTAAFTDLTFSSTSGRSFVLPLGNTISVSGVLTLAGTGSPIQLVSVDPSQPTSIVLGAGASVATTNALLGTNFTIDGSAIPRLANISTRMQVLTGNDVLIGGFVIGGASAKTVVVRARGPSLVPFGITNALADPQLQLVRSADQVTIATNNNWLEAPNAGAITASGFAPSHSLEAATLLNLPPGAYTAIVAGVGGSGVGIVEVFEVDAQYVPLANISTRGQVLTGNDVMIGGFIVQGSGPQAVVVRARGPSLIPFGITNALANPQLQLVRSSDQVTIATNDDWQSASNAAAITASGFAPSNDLESAILVTLDPGAYTAIVTGAGGGTGVGIVEVFAN